MLETPQERVKLLKAGVDGKTIEKLYLIYNNFKIANSLILIEQVEINIKENKNMEVLKCDVAS
ncbi:MAG TPA: hypothetical protein VIO58_10525 [Candidatus Methanoperedens sp.]